MIKNLILVSAGAVLGAVLRYGVYKLLPEQPHWMTFAINITGSFLLGLFAFFAMEKISLPYMESLALFAAVGFLGSFTTFSTFSKDIYMLMSDKWVYALLFAGAQVLSGVAAFGLGVKSLSLLLKQ